MRVNLLPLLVPHFKAPQGMKGENLICFDIACWLRTETLEGRLPYVWFHVPNQYNGVHRGLFGATLSWIGRIAGVPDYIFLGKNGCFCIEVKTKTGALSDSQKRFKLWCEDKEVPYYVCRSFEDMKNVVEEMKI